MATPLRHQPTNSSGAELAMASTAVPAAPAALPRDRMSRPPWRSTMRPAQGARKPEMNKLTVNAA
jgi:hypothetical protein